MLTENEAFMSVAFLVCLLAISYRWPGVTTRTLLATSQAEMTIDAPNYCLREPFPSTPHFRCSRANSQDISMRRLSDRTGRKKSVSGR
ncbi:uncharacterized protein EV420DRAFT_1533985 [Desarmillaria tabescens]|uniref:Uncharacterized protein n=1 Tax=Armillaria tabescens TaxID=1929756 RepID=A0AA39N821_ARMTA|nr:uncharacterized protein EV420DRAFT_1533985 [Desarmillaria tabescens]KAK0460742.1 hypothetical protein EV420DRAFT_1533985 [Desarmillaria tabescens]